MNQAIHGKSMVAAGVLAMVVAVAILQFSGVLFSTVDKSRASQVSSFLSPVTLSLVGEPVMTMTTIAAVGGNSATLPASETVTLAVTSHEPQLVNLTALNLPKGVWIHFVPSTVTSGPGGTSVQLVIAGAVVSNYHGNPSIIIHAASGGSGADLPLNIVSGVDFSVLQSPSSLIEFNDTLITNPTNSIPKYAGAVYDPANRSNLASTPLAVNFSAVGIQVDGATVPLPQGLQIDPPQAPLILSPDQPSYFYLGVITKNVPAGTYDVVIHELIDGTQFSTILRILVVESSHQPVT